MKLTGILLITEQDAAIEGDNCWALAHAARGLYDLHRQDEGLGADVVRATPLVMPESTITVLAVAIKLLQSLLDMADEETIDEIADKAELTVSELKRTLTALNSTVWGS